jgi:hypothetical protein
MSKATATPGFIAVTTAMLGVSLAISGAALWPIYESWHLIVLVGVSFIVGAAIAILGAVYRWPSALVMLASVAAYLLLGVPLAVPDHASYGVLPSLDGFIELLAGTAVGWKQLITITLPVGGFEALLVPAFVLMFFGTVIGLSVGLRARYGEVAVVIPAVIFIAAVAFGPESTDWPLPLALTLLVAALVWLIWARWYRRRASIRLLLAHPTSGDARAAESRDTRLGYRATLGAALTMTLAVGIALGAVWLFPVDNQREVLRSSVEEPFDPRDHSSPLSGLRAYHQDARADQPMFTVRGLPADTLIRIATLDTYDGVVYAVGSDQVSSLSGSFVRVPTSFDQSATAGEPIALQVTIDQYRGIWMPTVGKLDRVTFGGPSARELRGSFFYNDNSGTAVVTEPLSAGDSYRIEAVVPPQPGRGQVAGLQPGSAEVPDAQPLPEELALALRDYLGTAESPGARLQAMLEGLRANGYVSHGVGDDEPPSRSGHAADRITELLTGQRMIGDSEQYAVTAALMANQLGFPARVIFGFAPEEVDPDGVTTVRGHDVTAWIEVNTSRFGWVALDPNPEPREIPDEVPEDPTQVARPQSPVQPPPTEPDFTDQQLQPESSQEDPGAPNQLLVILLAVAQAAAITMLAVVILLSPFIAIAVAKVRRRALRRKAKSPIARVSGGWQEFADAVVDHGYDPPPVPTRTEVARTVGGTRSLVLASVADHAVFSPDTTEDAEADKVWRAVDELREALGQGRTRWERIKALVSVRSLGGYSVKSLFRR